MDPNPYEPPQEPSPDGAAPKRKPLSFANELRLLGYILVVLLVVAAADLLLFRLCHSGQTASPLP